MEDLRRWRIYKEPGPLYSSSKKKITSVNPSLGRIIISHVRLSTGTSHTMENTHPWIYKGWVFTHNGAIYDTGSLLDLLKEEHRESLEGETDSEAFFHLHLK
jgi:predicted glutamine amidotransferase